MAKKLKPVKLTEGETLKCESISNEDIRIKFALHGSSVLIETNTSTETKRIYISAGDWVRLNNNLVNGQEQPKEIEA